MKRQLLLIMKRMIVKGYVLSEMRMLIVEKYVDDYEPHKKVRLG